MKIIICIVILLILLVLVCFSIILRMNRLTRRSIAQDIHDDIGSTLNSIKLFACLAENTTDNKVYCNLISQSAKEAILSMRDMLWIIDDTSTGLDSLARRINHFGLPVTEASGIKLHIETKECCGTVKLSMIEKRNLLLIIKEAITNAVKYSFCSRISIKFSKVKHAKKISIEDDGIGICKQKVITGNGLMNIFERAKKIKYDISIESSPSQGTQILLTGKTKFEYLTSIIR